MTVAHRATPAAPSAPATKSFRFTMLLPTLMVSVAAPIAIFKGLEAFGVAPVWALAAGCVPPLLNNLRVWIASRRVDPVGILTMASIAGGPVALLLSGSLASRIVTDCLMGSAWGLGFLGSLLFRQPAMFFLIRSLVAGEDASRTETWNGLWRYAAFRSTLRWITAVWGASYFAGLLVELALTHLVTVDTVVTIGPLMSLGVTVGLVVFTRLRMKAMRGRLERVEHLKWPL
jgi:hypothetical protein